MGQFQGGVVGGRGGGYLVDFFFLGGGRGGCAAEPQKPQPIPGHVEPPLPPHSRLSTRNPYPIGPVPD